MALLQSTVIFGGLTAQSISTITLNTIGNTFDSLTANYNVVLAGTTGGVAINSLSSSHSLFVNGTLSALNMSSNSAFVNGLTSNSFQTNSLCAITGWLQSIYAANINQINGLNYSWPTNRGAANTYLKENGSGGLAFGDPLSSGVSYTIGVSGSTGAKIRLTFTNGLLSATAAG